ncbi:MAG: class IV adenylate cyclase [Ignavibacteria bacterium]|nr:class IV adenylate cyclase [Ignavibacteria bacterium]
MRQNYEIKTRIKSADDTRKPAVSYFRGKKFLHYTELQEDIYYRVRSGRLKLRIVNSSYGTLIFYSRSGRTGKRVSDYLLSPVPEPAELNRILGMFFKELVRVKKTREIFRTDKVRIHIDSVSGLGKYLEFEVIFNSFKKAERVMKSLIEHFGLDEKKFIKGSYSDLLLNKKEKQCRRKK